MEKPLEFIRFFWPSRTKFHSLGVILPPCLEKVCPRAAMFKRVCVFVCVFNPMQILYKIQYTELIKAVFL